MRLEAATARIRTAGGTAKVAVVDAYDRGAGESHADGVGTPAVHGWLGF